MKPKKGETSVFLLAIFILLLRIEALRERIEFWFIVHTRNFPLPLWLKAWLWGWR